MKVERKHVGALASRASGAVLQVALVLVVGRSLGAEALGEYLVFQAVVRVLGTVIGWGHPWYVLRTVSERDAVGDRTGSRTVFQRSLDSQLRVLAALAVVTPVVMIGAAVATDGWELSWLVLAAAGGTAGFACTAIGAHGLKARDLQVSALFLEFSITPLVVIGAAVVVAVFDVATGTVVLAVGHAASSLVGAGVSVWLFAGSDRAAPRPAGAVAVAAGATGTEGVASPHDAEALDDGASHSRLTFGLTNIVNVIGQNAPPLVLPLVLSLHDVGVIGAALRLTAIPGTLAVGLSSIYGPRFARLWILGDRERLRSVLHETQVWMTGLYLPFAVVFLAVPGKVNALLGDGFAGDPAVLRVLALGQLVNALTGQAPMMLSMCRDEFSAFTNMAVGVVLSVVLSLAAGAIWGIGGAALGLSIALAVQNLLIWARAQRAVLGRRRPRLVGEPLG